MENQAQNNPHVLLSVHDLVVKFRVRGRILTAIRNISLDIYENESIAIVGESGSGKSVFTKTFAGMLDANGFIDQGSILFDDAELADTTVELTGGIRRSIAQNEKKLNEYSRLEHGAETWREIKKLEEEKEARSELSAEETERMDREISDVVYQRTELFNQRQTYDPSREKDKIRESGKQLKQLDQQIERLQKEKRDKIAARKREAAADHAWLQENREKISALETRYREETAQPITEAQKERNARLAKEIELSVGRFSVVKRERMAGRLLKSIREAMREGKDLSDDAVCNKIFESAAFRVRLLDENEQRLHGTCALDLAKVREPSDWTKIRGTRIATVFQDPMTSLNPIITIGKQITSIILKHQQCSEVEARKRALELMMKVGIPNAEKRFDDYPFQYSGGMRQRIVIAIALSCQPKILICDEPTTALDVTIQAQILKLLKDLQKEFQYTIVFITHDLGVVANIADRVAVMYAGQIVEYGGVEEVFYDPRHPYTWALLSSLPQLATKDTELFSITGTPPSLYNRITGDPFAPRNPYCMKIDTLKEPPMFRVSPTHFAKTWLEDPRSPKVQKPEIIENIHEKLVEAYNI